MELIAVIDLMAGCAVRARGGLRERYMPVKAVGEIAVDGHPVVLAREYVERFGLNTLYMADLDAIGGGHVSGEIVAAMAAVAPLWLDAGISSVQRAQEVINLGVTRAVIGLETLASFAALAATRAAIGVDRIAFSLDLRGGEPLVTHADLPREPAHQLAARAVAAGVTTLIVIDLARVGTGTGPDFDVLARVRTAVPGSRLFAGGGVRDLADLIRLADLGCDGALVASALHDEALSVADVMAARSLGRHDSATR